MTKKEKLEEQEIALAFNPKNQYVAILRSERYAKKVYITIKSLINPTVNFEMDPITYSGYLNFNAVWNDSGDRLALGNNNMLIVLTFNRFNEFVAAMANLNDPEQLALLDGMLIMNQTRNDLTIENQALFDTLPFEIRVLFGYGTFSLEEIQQPTKKQKIGE
jgi:hypothetical protein